MLLPRPLSSGDSAMIQCIIFRIKTPISRNDLLLSYQCGLCPHPIRVRLNVFIIFVASRVKAACATRYSHWFRFALSVLNATRFRAALSPTAASAGVARSYFTNATRLRAALLAFGAIVTDGSNNLFLSTFRIRQLLY